MPGYGNSGTRIQSFEPSPISQAWTWEDARINLLLEQGSRVLRPHGSSLINLNAWVFL